jgi:hypothetical protein
LSTTRTHSVLPATPLPDFRSPAFLRRHIADTMQFYHPHAIDPAGGFFHYFKDDGTIYGSRQDASEVFDAFGAEGGAGTEGFDEGFPF